jgi:hypothetical protein
MTDRPDRANFSVIAPEKGELLPTNIGAGIHLDQSPQVGEAVYVDRVNAKAKQIALAVDKSHTGTDHLSRGTQLDSQGAVCAQRQGR